MDADRAIKERLDRSLRVVEPPPPRAADVILRGRRLRRRSVMVGIAGSLAAIVAVGAPLVLLSPLGDRPGNNLGSEPGAIAVEAEIPLDPGLTDVEVGFGSVWVTGAAGVVEVDTATNRVLARIAVPGTGDRSRIAIGEGAVWVTAPELRDDGSRGNLVRIDPGTAEVDATFELGGPITGVGTGGGSVWVTIPGPGPGTLLRVEPSTGRILDRVRVGASPGSPVYAHGFVWVPSPESVTKVEPTTVTLVEEFPVPNVQASGGASLWGTGIDSVVRSDPGSGRIQATMEVQRAVAVSVHGTTVWVLVSARSSDPELFEPIPGTAEIRRIDPFTNEVIGDPLRLEDLQPIGLSGDARTVWVADFDSGTLTRVGSGASARRSDL